MQLVIVLVLLVFYWFSDLGKYADLGLSDTENTEEDDSSDDEGIVIGSSGFSF